MKLSLTSSTILFLAAINFISANNAAAEAVAIGGGYFCDGTTVLKGTKVVKASSVKKSLSDKIASLGNSTKDKAKKKTLSNIKKAVGSCSKGQTPGEGTPNARTLFGNTLGNYTGTYSGGGTATGNLTFSITDDGTNFIFNITLGANAIFAPLETNFIVNVPAAKKIPASGSVSGTNLGKITITIQNFNGDNQMVIENDSTPQANRGTVADISKFYIVLVNTNPGLIGTMRLLTDNNSIAGSGSVYPNKQ